MKFRRDHRIAASTAVMAGFLILGCRRGMEEQPKFRPFQENDFFSDGRSARLPVPGTVARGSLVTEEAPITRAGLERGRENYDIFCAVCHDRVGTGNGMIVQRGFPRPPSFHLDRLRQAPDDHFFDVITNGFGRMYPYGDRLSARERREVIMYIRALQLSQNARLADAPADQRTKLGMTSNDEENAK